jgi:chromosome segregation ATPase
LYLWLLFHMDVDRQEREARLEELRQELTEKEAFEEKHNATLKQLKKKASAARRQTQAADKKRVTLAAEVDKLEPSVIQATEEIKTLKKKIQGDQTQLKKKKEHSANHKGTLKELAKNLTEAIKELKQLEDEYEVVKRDAAPDQVTLTEAQEEEYERVKEAAAQASVEPRRNLANVNKRLESARVRAAETASELAEINNRTADVTREVNSLTERSEKLSSVRI